MHKFFRTYYWKATFPQLDMGTRLKNNTLSSTKSSETTLRREELIFSQRYVLVKIII